MPEARLVPELVASYWTLAGCYPGRGDSHSRFDFRDRVIAARKAGFAGIGLLDTDLQQTLRTLSLRDCKKILNDEGLTHVELEFLVDWFETGEKRRASDKTKQFLWEAAEVLNPALIKVGDFSHADCSLSRLVDSFGSLCREAQAIGTRIAFEPMGAAVIDNLADALALVQGAGASNGGLAIDIWHMAFLGIPFAEVAAIPKEFLLCAELNDAKWSSVAGLTPSVDRRFCGEGDLDTQGFIDAIRKTGFEGPWGVELFSEELVELSLTEAATKAVQTTMAQFH